jgi:hypothetical protein
VSPGSCTPIMRAMNCGGGLAPEEASRGREAAGCWRCSQFSKDLLHGNVNPQEAAWHPERPRCLRPHPPLLVTSAAIVISAQFKKTGRTYLEEGV